MPTIGDIYQLKLFSRMNGQDCLNVFYYKNQTAVGSAAALASNFWTGNGAALRAISNSEVVFENIVCENINDVGDNDTYVMNVTGNVTGDFLPQFVCWSFLYSRLSRAVRNGWKRFPGVSESSQSDGLPTSGTLADLNALAADLGALVDTGGSDQYAPIIFHKTASSPLAGIAYPIGGVSFHSISTQNTRKR